MAKFWAIFALVAASLSSQVASSSTPLARRGKGSEIQKSSNSMSGADTIVEVAGSGSTEIIIIESNSGGSSATKYWNNQTMTAGQVHQVTVGGSAGLVYSPDTITAAIGDMVQFNFMSQNHTATQSSFGTPCMKLASGADSGFMPNPSNSASPPPMMLFQVTVNTPIWMYCRQMGHCGKGMVFSINPTAAKSQAAFKAAAIAQNGTPTASSSQSPSAASPAAAQSSSSSSLAQGSGTLDSGGACSCSCLCAAEAFPAGAGIGAMGGVGGQLSLVAAAAQKRSLSDHIY